VNGTNPARRPSGPAETSGVIAARLRRGVRLPSGRIAGESDREVHLFPVPIGAGVPSQLTALCGLVITPGMADQITAITGMPCTVCLALSARRAAGGADVAGHQPHELSAIRCSRTSSSC
jgi:hypothetical protein